MDRMYIVDSGAALHMMAASSLSAGKEDHTEDQKLPGDPNREGTIRSTEEARVDIQELGTYLYVKLVDEFPSVLSLGRLLIR